MASHWIAHLAEVSVRSLALALIAAAVLAVLGKRRTAALQHAVWTAVLGGMLLLMVLEPVLPQVALRVLRESPPAPATAAPPFRAIPPAPPAAQASSPRVTKPRPSPARQRPLPGWHDIALFMYVAIALAFLMRLAAAYFLLRRLLAASHRVEVAAGAPTWYESPSLAVPLTVGWLRPKILLPPSGAPGTAPSSRQYSPTKARMSAGAIR